MSDKLKFIPRGDVRSDCMQNYDVELLEPMTIKDFTRWVVENRKYEWGTVSLCDRQNISDTLLDLLVYSRGEVINANIILWKLAEHHKIKSIRACGGWSVMDYYIELDFEETKAVGE